MSVDRSTPVSPRDSRSNLPLQLTRFIGREREVDQVRRLLGETRLLTVVAADLEDAYPDGVCLAELAALSDPALVAETVAAAVGVRDAPGGVTIDGLVDALRDKAILLVLDNCEHLVVAAAQLADALLRRCPGLGILATSRETLGIAGETTWLVPSLEVPPQGAGEDLTAERAGRYDAVRLFIDRAAAVQPGFLLTGENAGTAVEICRRLDGIPLAIELAAARIKVFSVAQIAARLDDRFRLLSAGRRTALPRQQTLRAMVEWSHALLSQPERILFRRLSVFAGGWRFEAAEAVGAGEGIQRHAVLDLLAQLVDKSLVIAEEERGVVRYRMLETIREYAAEALAASDEMDRVRSRHLAYFLGFAEQAEPGLRGGEAPVLLETLEAEHDNLRAALEWAVAGACDDAALRLSGALAWFWWLRSHHTEGSRWLMRALAASGDRGAARMKALSGAAWLAHHRRESAAAGLMAAEALEIARALDDRPAIAWSFQILGRIAYFDGDPDGARSLGEASLAVAEETGDGWLIAWALHLLGLAAYIAEDFPTARAYYTRSLEIRRSLGYEEGMLILLVLLGFVAFREADLDRARTLYRESLAVEQKLGGPWNLGMILASFSSLAAARGQPVRAVRLAAAAVRLSETHATPLIPLAETLMIEGLATAGRALDEADYAAAWAEGRAMTRDQEFAEALAVEVALPDSTPPADGAPAVSDGNLTPAEIRVLQLLAGGHTTKEIAGELVVAVSTVDRHLTHIYQKLSVSNRAGAVAFALTRGLV